MKKKYKENIIKIKEWEVMVNVDDKEEMSINKYFCKMMNMVIKLA